MDNRPQRPYLVFVSHATQDEWIAKCMAEVIERKGRRHGVKAFLDARDLESGDHSRMLSVTSFKKLKSWLCW